MKIAKFFIDRPIFAAVLSILIFVAGLLALRVADHRVSGSGAAIGGRARAVSRCQSEGDRGNRRRAAGAGDQRRREHAVHVLAGDQRRHDGADRDIRLGTDVDRAQVQVQNRVAQALPRLPEDVRASA